MNARDELAKVIESGYGDDPTDCPYDHAPAIADVVLASGYRKPRTIETREALAVENYVVVRSSAGTIANLVDGRAHFFGYEASVPAKMLALPATVLWEPEATA